MRSARRGPGPRLRFVNNALSPLFDCREDFCHHLIAWLRADVALTVEVANDGVGFHVAISDYESRVGGMDFHLLGVCDLRLHVIAAGV